MTYKWVKTTLRLPPDETPVLVIYKRRHMILELAWERPGFEDTHQPFRYWDSPNDPGSEFEFDEVTHWADLLTLPAEVILQSSLEQSA